MNANKHYIFPPNCLFSGTIGEGIIKFSQQMIDSDINFEGFFIVIDQNNGFKWKTPYHEEQPKILKTNHIKFLLDNSKKLYNILENIFEQKNKKKIINSEKLKKDNLTYAIIQAYNKECSKMLEFSENDKINIIDKILIPIITEVSSHYIDSEIQCPWTDTEIKNKAIFLLKDLINK